MKDPAVRSVSLEARGLWTDMLCLMFECDRRGYLQHATGKLVTQIELSRMVGSTPGDVSRLLQELENSGVFSRTEHGLIYSRRMIRDEQIRQVRSEAGSKGGNPVLLKQNPTKGLSKTQAKLKQNTESESEYENEFEKLWSRYPRKDGKKESLKHFHSSVRTQEDLKDIAISLDHYLLDLEGRKVVSITSSGVLEQLEPQFIKKASTWFNNWRDWLDWKPPRSTSEMADLDQPTLDELTNKIKADAAKKKK